MRKILVTSRNHKIQLVTFLGMLVMVPLSLRLTDSSQAAGAAVFYFTALLAYGESVNFIRRSVAWEANQLVPGYRAKIWKTCIGIVGVCFVFALLLSFTMGDFTPPVGLAVMFTVISLATTYYTRRTESKSGNLWLNLMVCLALSLPLLMIFNPTVARMKILDTASAIFVQVPAITIAMIATLFFKREFDRITRMSDAVPVEATDRFHPDVAGRLRICGWPLSSTRFLPHFFWSVPIFSIVYMSTAAFEHLESSLLTNHSLVLSVVTGIVVYIGTGTPFGLLKNPGLWLGQAWRLGVGRSRRDVGREFARNIVKASIFPAIVVFGVTFIHAMYVEDPLADWTGYVNFYDEGLLLLTVNLLCFAWACASYPSRTTECPDFLQIRVVMCIAACFVFVAGVDFGPVIRTVVLITVILSATISIYLGGDLIARIDFLANRKRIQAASVIE